MVHQGCEQNTTRFRLERKERSQWRVLSCGLGAAKETFRIGWSWCVEPGVMCWALQVRWLWLSKMDPSQCWSSLDIPVNKNLIALFNNALQTDIG